MPQSTLGKAAARGHLEVVQFLCLAGADKDKQIRFDYYCNIISMYTTYYYYGYYHPLLLLLLQLFVLLP